MSRPNPLQLAREPLLRLADASGSRHASRCAALLELLTTGECLGQAMRHELGRLGLSSNGFGVLVLLRRPSDEPWNTGGLASALDLPAHTISEALARLEMAALVIRRRNPDNRRQNMVELTPAGRHVIDRTLDQFESSIHRRMEVLNPTELKTLRRACHRLCPAPPSAT